MITKAHNLSTAKSKLNDIFPKDALLAPICITFLMVT